MKGTAPVGVDPSKIDREKLNKIIEELTQHVVIFIDGVNTVRKNNPDNFFEFSEALTGSFSSMMHHFCGPHAKDLAIEIAYKALVAQIKKVESPEEMFKKSEKMDYVG